VAGTELSHLSRLHGDRYLAAQIPGFSVNTQYHLELPPSAPDPET
jgi:hypothetical protein